MTQTSNSHPVIAIQDILRRALDGVYVIDSHRRFLLFSESCERLTGYKAYELVGRDCCCYNVLDCRDEYDRPLKPSSCPVKAIFEGTISFARHRTQIRRKDGQQLWVETNYTPVYNKAGAVDYVLAVMRDIADNKARENHLLEQIARLRQRVQQLAPTEYSEEELARPPQGAIGPRGPVVGIRDPGRIPGRDEAPSLNLDPILADVERAAIRRALRTANWQRNKAAQLMGISRSRLYRRMEALGIDPNQQD